MIYTDEYETRTAVSEANIGDAAYRWEYTSKSPIDGKATDVNATLYMTGSDSDTRLAYASYSHGGTSVRFDGNTAISVDVQSVLCAQFYTDLQLLLA